MSILNRCKFHELSMALVWLYYGFAMNGILIKDSQKICRK